MRAVSLRIISVTLLLFSQFLFAQNDSQIVGIWTDANAYESDTFGETYIFKGDHTFNFIYSNYKWAGRRIISFSGKYQIVKDSIYFQITETKELVGGHINYEGAPNGLGWVIVDGKEKIFKQPENEHISIAYSFESKSNKKYILIDGERFIQYDKNPDARFNY